MNLSIEELAKDIPEEYALEDRDRVIAMIESGLTPVYSKPNLLTIDLDSPAAIEEFDKRITKFKELFSVRQIVRTSGVSGRGAHIYVQLWDEYGIPERLAMEAILGSDPTRGMLNVVRFKSGVFTSADDNFETNKLFLFEKDPSLVKFDIPTVF